MGMDHSPFWQNVDRLREASLLSVETFCHEIDVIMHKQKDSDTDLYLKQSTYVYYIRNSSPSPRKEILAAIYKRFHIKKTDTDLDEYLLSPASYNRILTGGLNIEEPDPEENWGLNLWDNINTIEQYYMEAGRVFPDIELDRSYRLRLEKKQAVLPLKSVKRLAEKIGLGYRYPVLYLRRFNLETCAFVKSYIFFPAVNSAQGGKDGIFLPRTGERWVESAQGGKGSGSIVNYKALADTARSIAMLTFLGDIRTLDDSFRKELADDIKTVQTIMSKYGFDTIRRHIYGDRERN